jgi:D-xylose transport system substrate-binding protein
MRRTFAVFAALALVLGACNTGGGGGSAAPGGSGAPAGSGGTGGTACKVGISWNNFQQPRWAATDKPAMFKAIQDGGGSVVGDPDANLDSQKQLSDVDTLINNGAQVLVLLAQDQNAILPALQRAKDANIPVIAYDRLIEDPYVLFISFDNVGVGKAQAEALFAEVPTGNYVLIKGDPGDPNAKTFLPLGWDEAGLKDKVDSGEINIIGPADGTYTPAWKTETAQANMEAIIDQANAADEQIDAVLAENDSTALGVAAALTGKAYEPYPAVSGQDGDKGNLNNVALGKQYVDVWKNSNELGKAAGQAALALCKDKDTSKVTVNVDASVAPTGGNTAVEFTTPGDNKVNAVILKPTPVTADTLDLVIDAGWYVTKEEICEGADTTAVPDCA